MTTLRLVDDDDLTLLSMIDGGLGNPMLTKLDLGYPTVRTASAPLSGQDGENDLTQLTGARAVVAEALITFGDSAQSLADTIRALMHPGRRYWLYLQMDDWPSERRIRVRGGALSLPMGPLPWAVQMGWQAPRPALEDLTATSVTLNPVAQAGGGRTYPRVYPWSYTPGLPPGASVLTVDGSTSAVPTIDIYGPCTGPLIRVVDTGAQLSFPNLTIAPGDYLHIDVGARTITLNSDPAEPRYQTLDFATATWPTLPPGSPLVVFSPTSSSPGSMAVVTWRSLWL